jgi:predicted MFS family arabinose efflux permease
MKPIYEKITGLHPEFLLFLAAASLSGFSQSIVESTFNNFLNESFGIGNFQRGLLELPREMPGFLVVAFSALFFFAGSRRLAAFANLLAAAGIFLVGTCSTGFSLMLLWLFVFSTGQHLFLPLTSSIGMEFAREGNAGRLLGDISGAMNLAAIAGSLVIFLGFRFFDFTFTASFSVAAAGFLLAAALIFFMSPDDPQPVKAKFTLRREYRLYYWLTILYGTRKQLFITFAPWVLVTVFKQKTQMVATLLTIGGVIGIFFKPMLGRAIDRLGERRILMGEAASLIVICLLYGFSRALFPEDTALLVTFGCYIIDQLLMSVGMARATWMRKIAVAPEDIAQTLTMGTTIDHFFSISIALVSGLIWMMLGYQYVFLLGAFIAAVNLFSAARIRIPGSRAAGGR